MPETEPTPAPETEPTPAPETEPDNLHKLLDDLKSDFTAKLQAQAAKYEKEIAERDKYIKSLLTSSDEPTNSSIAEKLNEKRKFKKW